MSVTNKEKKLIIEQFKGYEFDYECPSCKKISKMKILNNGNVKCCNCQGETFIEDGFFEEVKDLFKSMGFM